MYKLTVTYCNSNTATKIGTQKVDRLHVMLRYAFNVNELIYFLQNVSLTFQYVSVTCLYNDNYYHGTIHGMADASNRYNAVLQTVFNLTSFIYTATIIMY